MPRLRLFVQVVRCAVCASAVFVTAPAFAATCESLAALKLPGTTITAAQVVAAGAFKPTPPPSAANLKLFESLPAFCRVQGVIQPSSDSHIEFEVWMPASGWNGKYLGVGNVGLGGSILYAWGLPVPDSNYPSLQSALRAVHATRSRPVTPETGDMWSGRACSNLRSCEHPGTEAEPKMVRICPLKSVARGVLR